MNRRNFLRAMVGGVAVAAAERTFPFRVFSFPKEVAPAGMVLTPVGFKCAIEYTQLTGMITREMLKTAFNQMRDRSERAWPQPIYMHPRDKKLYEELAYAIPVID